jgi:hypothetical protein
MTKPKNKNSQPRGQKRGVAKNQVLAPHFKKHVKKGKGMYTRNNTYLRKTFINENVSLLMCNMKTNIPHNRCKCIPHGIMGCHPFLAMKATKKVNPHGI